MTSKSNRLRSAYHAYLIRCWITPARPNNGTPGHQRFVVETISDQPRRRGFDSLTSLLAFLQIEMAAANDKPMNAE